MIGFDAPYVPGWDCHGLPIEVMVEKKLGRPKTPEEAKRFRQSCRDYANEWVNIQREEFERMGILGNWKEPYLTMDPRIEADIVRSLGKCYAGGHITQGHKPVLWCLDCQSALAEAEVEYRDKSSHAVTVLFPEIKNSLSERFKNDTNKPAGLAAWTTTPWTLPANAFLAVNPQDIYQLLEFEGMSHLLVVSEKLVPSLVEELGIKHSVVAAAHGSELEGAEVKHPFYDRPSQVLVGEHVDTETGTGVVHSAPAYGLDDFDIAKREKIEIMSLVDDKGFFSKQTGKLAGCHIYKDEGKIIKLLKDSGTLISEQPKYRHSYPHCWRHKTPVIYRATRQWFLEIKDSGIAEASLKEIDKVKFIPQTGQNRLSSMIEAREEWCISRQRAWGVPITILIDKKTGKPHPKSAELFEPIARLIEKQGVDAWFSLDPEDLIGKEGSRYRKVTDILDVWFDSGTTHCSVLERRTDTSFPANMYLEGSDQHRGWFQSSLLASVAIHDRAPFSEVLTHGFTVDQLGRKMSKSVGNIIEPKKIIEQHGADVLRYWVLSSDYTKEISISEEILQRCSDAYRKIRNTLRYLLSNLKDFNPRRHLVEPGELLLLDKWILKECQRVHGQLTNWYAEYRFWDICRQIHLFCTLQLASVYLEIIKDRQYTFISNSPGRRSAQTSCFHLINYMCRWLAPILSFTSDEAYEKIPGREEESIFLASYQDLDLDLIQLADEEEKLLDLLFELREKLLARFEKERNAKNIGSSLATRVTLSLSPSSFDLVQPWAGELKYFFNVSELQIDSKASGDSIDEKTFKIESLANNPDYKKCDRCWHHFRAPANAEPLCPRCQQAVKGKDEEKRKLA